MIIAVQGSKTFDSYEVFMRAMGVAMSDAKQDSEIQVWSVGPYRINNYAISFSNLSENYLKTVGKRIKCFNVSESFVNKHIGDIDYFAYLCKPHENASPLTAVAEFANLEVGIFRY